MIEGLIFLGIAIYMTILLLTILKGQGRVHSERAFMVQGVYVVGPETYARLKEQASNDVSVEVNTSLQMVGIPIQVSDSCKSPTGWDYD